MTRNVISHVTPVKTTHADLNSKTETGVDKGVEGERNIAVVLHMTAEGGQHHAKGSCWRMTSTLGLFKLYNIEQTNVLQTIACHISMDYLE